MLFEVDFLRFLETYINDSDVEEEEEQILTTLKEKLQQNPQEYAGIIIKPWCRVLVKCGYADRIFTEITKVS